MRNSDVRHEREQAQEISVEENWNSKPLTSLQVFVAGTMKVVSSRMWRRVGWYIIVLNCQRNLLLLLSRLGADGKRRFLWYTSTGLLGVTLQKTLTLEPTIFIVFGYEYLGPYMPTEFLNSRHKCLCFIAVLQFHCSLLCLCCRAFGSILQFRSNLKVIGTSEYFCASDCTNWLC
jgi:hypothetical protein